MSKRELNIWMLSDDKPGHYNQSLGLIEALRKSYLVRYKIIPARMRLGFMRLPLRLACNLRLGSHSQALIRRLARLAYGKLDLPNDKPDLILSCGGQTAFLNILLGRITGAPNLFLGTLRGLRPSHFTAVVSGLYIADTPNLVELTLSPGLFNREQMELAGYRFRETFGLRDAKLWTMLVGGDGAGYSYTNADMRTLLEGMAQLADQRGIRWLLTTSRRTAPKHEKMIVEFAKAHSEHFADLVAYHQDPQKVVQAYLGAADAIFCTEDSSSMLSEAISAGKPVFSLHPKSANPNANYRAFLNKHSSEGRLMSLPLSAFALDLLRQRLEDHFTPLSVSLDQQILLGLAPYLELESTSTLSSS